MFVSTKLSTLLQELRRRAPADEPRITIDNLRNGSYGEKSGLEGEREREKKMAPSSCFLVVAIFKFLDLKKKTSA